MKNFVVKKIVSIKATPSKVWDALTNPEKTRKYFFNCRVFSDWKVGSPITFIGRIFLIKKIELKGKILRIEPQKILKYALVNGPGDSHSLSTVTDKLSYVKGRTILSITDDVGEGEGAEKRYKRSVKAWDKVLRRLKELVEQGNKRY